MTVLIYIPIRSSPRRETRVLATPTIAPKVVIPAVPQPLPNPPPPAPITPWVVEPPAPITLKLVPLPISSEEQDLQLLLSWANTWPAHWETLVGLYFVEGRHPGSVLPLEKMGQVYCFRRDLRKEDMFAADPYSVDVWRLPEGEDSLVIQQAAVWVGQGRQAVFEEGIRRWVPTLRPIIGQVAPLLPFMAKAMWSNTNVAGFFDPDWWDMNKLKQMAEGPEKGALLESVRVNSPRVHAARMNDSICGYVLETPALK